MKQVVGIMLLTLLGGGCGSLRGPNQAYVAPAVEGRVVDATSKTPLERARIQRHLGEPPKSDPLAEKGAQRLLTVPTVRSDAAGRFSMAGEKGGYLLMSHGAVYTFTLVVRQPGYQTLTTNIDLLEIKPITTNGVWTVKVGDLPLRSKTQDP